MTQTPNEKGFFVQFPIYLISSCPDLTRDDKWVLLSLMQDHRTEGPFKLSFRSISTISGVPLSLLSSYTDKKGTFHEGIMERIERVTGYVHCEMGKEIDPATGKAKGNTQSYITINYTKIWQDNRMYSETKQNRPVSNTNTLFEPVLNTVKPVSNTNGSVPITNRLVSNTNEPVSNSRSEVPPYITEDSNKNIQITEERESEQCLVVETLGIRHSLSSNSHNSSAESVSSPPVAGDTLNLANSANVKPEFFAQHNVTQQSSESVASSEPPDNNATPSYSLTNGCDDANKQANSQGYMKEHNQRGSAQGDSVPSGDDAGQCNSARQSVATNSTLLLSWLAALETELTKGKIKHFAIGRIAEKPADMQRLLSAVQSLDQLRDLYKSVRSQKMFSDGRLIWATNLAKLENIAAWQESCGAQQEAIEPLTEASRNDLERDIRAEYPALWIQQANDPDFGLILLIWYGDDQADYILVRDREDWKYWRSDPLLERAVAYAEEVLNREAEQQQAIIDEQETRQSQPTSESSSMAEGTCNALMDVIRTWSPALKLTSVPSQGGWIIRVRFGALDYQYFEIDSHADWERMKQEDEPMLQQSVRYGMSLEMAVAV